MVLSVKELKDRYSGLTDAELLEEREYRAGCSTRMVGIEGVILLGNIRRAVAELIAERGLGKAPGDPDREYDERMELRDEWIDVVEPLV